MKKSLLITMEYPPFYGGVAHYYEHVTRSIAADSIVILAHHKANNQSYLSQHYTIYQKDFLRFPLWPKWLFLLTDTYKILQREKIDFIQVGHILPVGIVAYFFKKVFHLPYLVYTHAMDITLPAQNKWKKFLITQILKNADQIITVSHYTKNQIQKLTITTAPITIIAPAIETPCITLNDASCEWKTVYPKSDVFTLFTIARLMKRKGIDHVLDALEMISQDQKTKDIPMRYIISGTGEEQENLKNKAKRFVNTNIQVIFTNKISEEQKKYLFSICDVFIMPSYEPTAGDVEGFGIVFLEAHSFGKPVISTRSGGIPDAVLDDQNGILVKTGDVQAIAQAILRIHLDPQMADEMGRNGFTRLQTDFSMITFKTKLLRVLNTF